MPVLRLTSSSIWRSFQNSHKKHLVLTGSKGIGKSTLFQELFAFLPTSVPALHQDSHSVTIPGITTHAIPQTEVLLRDNMTGETAVIGRFSSSTSSEAGAGHQMLPVETGFLTLGMNVLKKFSASLPYDSSWVTFDELGYLENSCPAFQREVIAVFNHHPVLAVIRKQSTPFLNSIRNRKDVFLYDLDEPVLPVGCVIMASGLGKRFGGNKLLADFHGKPLLSHIIEITGHSLFADRIVVTRNAEIQAFCKKENIPVLLHDLPGRNDTIRLGLEALQNNINLTLRGCLFAVSDQPLLSRESLESMVLSFSQNATGIYRFCFSENSIPFLYGNPVLFEKTYFSELSQLPPGKGGSVLLSRYADHVKSIPVIKKEELFDIDTTADLIQLEHLLSENPSSSSF